MSERHSDDGPTMEISVSERAVALEIGYGILGRATDIHDNPHDDFEHIAEELKGIGEQIIALYEQDDDEAER